MSGGIQILRMIVESAFGTILHKADKQKPVKDYCKSTTFTARGGAWIMIVVCVLFIALLVWIMATDSIIHNDWWAICMVLFVAVIVYLLFLLRYSISLLKAKIIVGSESLVLDGACVIRPGHGFKHMLQQEYFDMVPSDLVVEIPWSDINNIGFSIAPRLSLPAGMTVETRSNE